VNKAALRDDDCCEKQVCAERDDGQKKDIEQEKAIQADGPHEWSRNDRV
jgi:hypothetical protein